MRFVFQCAVFVLLFLCKGQAQNSSAPAPTASQYCRNPGDPCDSSNPGLAGNSPRLCGNGVCICNFGVLAVVANNLCPYTEPEELLFAYKGVYTLPQATIQGYCNAVKGYRLCFASQMGNCTRVYSNQPDGCSVVWKDEFCTCNKTGALCPAADLACGNAALMPALNQYCDGLCVPTFLLPTSTTSPASSLTTTIAVVSSVVGSLLANTINVIDKQTNGTPVDSAHTIAPTGFKAEIVHAGVTYNIVAALPVVFAFLTMVA